MQEFYNLVGRIKKHVFYFTGSAILSALIYQYTTDAINRKSPLVTQTLINYITQSGNLNLIKDGELVIEKLKCNVNQFKGTAKIKLLMKRGNSSMSHENIFTKKNGHWISLNDSSSPNHQILP